MKKRLIMTTVITALLVSLTACGGQEDVTQEGTIAQNGQVQQSAEQSQEQGGDVSEGQATGQEQEVQASQEVTPEPTQESSESAKQESGAGSESAQENVWVPDAFVYNDVKSLDFVAPAAHTGGGEQCTFLWNCEEGDVKTWFVERYGDMEGKVTERVSNTTGTNGNSMRSYGIFKSNSQDYYSLYVSTGRYHESVVHSANFTAEGLSQDVVIEDVKAFFEVFGLGDYAEDIIFSEELSLEIPTENGRGTYSVSASYGTSEYSKKYSIMASVSYLDADFYYEIEGYDAANIEYWEDYYTLADYMPNCEFDTSSVAALTEAEQAYIVELYGNIYDKEVSLEENFSYKRENFETLTEVEFEYWARCKDANYESGCLSLKYTLEDDEAEFTVSALGRYPFEDRGQEHRNISSGKDLTDTEIQELCEARYTLMKKLDSEIDFTVEDLVKLYRDYEMDEDCDKTTFEGEGYKYRIYNSLSGLNLYKELE